MQSSTHEIIYSQTQNLFAHTHLSSMQQHHLTARMNPNTTSRDREFKKIGEYDDMSDNNDELQQELDSRRRPCLGDKNEAPHQKKQQKPNPTDNAAENKGVTTTTTTKATEVAAAAAAEDTGRERLKRHRVEVAGRVWIPDIWGQEELLKDWIDCCGFDASLMNSNVMSAREALMEEGRRATSSRLRIENSC